MTHLLKIFVIFYFCNPKPNSHLRRKKVALQKAIHVLHSVFLQFHVFLPMQKSNEYSLGSRIFASFLGLGLFAMSVHVFRMVYMLHANSVFGNHFFIIENKSTYDRINSTQEFFYLVICLHWSHMYFWECTHSSIIVCGWLLSYVL